MLKIAVCDDEVLFQEQLSEMIKAYCETRKMKYELICFSAGKDLYKYCQMKIENLFDIVFLDIDMEEMNGLETAKLLGELCPKTKIVLVTAFISYVLEGYKVKAVRYILKNDSELQRAIVESLDASICVIETKNEERVIDFIEGKKKILLSQILYLESNLHKVKFHFLNTNKVYSRYEKLDQIERELNQSYFLRIHKSYLINLEELLQYKRYEAIMKSGISIPIPKAKYREVYDTYVAFKGEL